VELYLHPSCMPSGHGQGQFYLFEFWNIYFKCTTDMLPFESDISAANGRSVFICNNLMIPQFVLAAVCVLIQTVAYTARCRVACEGHSKMTSLK
jgi:hypothetical protein